MSDITTIINGLIAEVNDKITTNGQEEITGAVHRQVLTTIIQGVEQLLTMGDDYLLNQFPPYDSDFTYLAAQDYIVSYNQQLWVKVANGSFQGIQPGTNAGVWRRLNVLSLVHNQGRDLMLDGSGPNKVTAAEIRQFIDSFNPDASLTLHTYITPGTSSQKVLIPDRPIVSMMVNGAHYNAYCYTLNPPMSEDPTIGIVQELTWLEIGFAIDENDEITIIYSGLYQEPVWDE